MSYRRSDDDRRVGTTIVLKVGSASKVQPSVLYIRGQEIYSRCSSPHTSKLSNSSQTRLPISGPCSVTDC
jgi:hypothetical protein